MAKLALLIGVSEYISGLPSLPAVQGDLESMKRALEDPRIGKFNVETLLNPNRQTVADAIEELFSNKKKEDLILLYFSGHGVKDENNRLYLTSHITRAQSDRLVKSTAVEASFIQDQMRSSRSRRQVIILDCCFSGAFAEGLPAKSAIENISQEIKSQLFTEELRATSGFGSPSAELNSPTILSMLGSEGRAILTSSSSTQPSFEERGSNISVYTKYLVEGLTTGVADLDGDGVITIKELHEYARSKVIEASPAMEPEIYAIREGYNIKIADASSNDPRDAYRKELEKSVRNGKFSIPARERLNLLRAELNLSLEVAAEVESEVCQPFHEREQKLQDYERVLELTAKEEFPFSQSTRRDLKDYQQTLKLRDEDVASIHARIEHGLSATPFKRSRLQTLRQMTGVAVAAVLLLSIGTVIYQANRDNRSDSSGGKVSPSSIQNDKLRPVAELLSAGDNPTLSGSGSSLYRFVGDLNQKGAGIKAFAAREYGSAFATFSTLRETALLQNNDGSNPIKDPEVLIFQNNAKARENYQQGAEIFTIAAAVPLSDANGNHFNIGQQMLMGVAQAQSKAIAQGLNLEVVIANDRNLPQQAQTLAEALGQPFIVGADNQQREILAVVGHYSSTVTCAALPIYNSVRLPVVSPLSTRTDLRETCDGEEVFFRTTSSSAIEAGTLANYLVNVSGVIKPNVAVFYKKEEGYSQDLSEAFQAQLSVLLNNNITFSEFNLSDSSDIESGKQRLNEFNVLALLPDGRTENDAAFVKAFEVLKAGAEQSKLILGSNPLYDWRTARENPLITLETINNLKIQSGSLEKGLIISVDWFPGCGSQDNFIAEAEKLWLGPPNRVTALSYEAVQVIADRLSRGKTTRLEILNDLNNPEQKVKSDVFESKTISFTNGERNEITNRVLVTPAPNGNEPFSPIPGAQSCSS